MSIDTAIPPLPMETSRQRTVRKHKLMSQYNLTLEEYAAIYERQGGRCAVCRTDNPGGRQYKYRPQQFLCVDHCHTSGRVRGLLCSRCNRSIGMLEDDPQLLLAALAYLESAV